MSLNDDTGHCVHCGRDNNGYEHLPYADDCPGEEASQRMVQVDGGEAVSLETCFKVNDCFSSSERADCIAGLEAHGEWRYPIGGGGFCTITWATPRAALETEYRDWLHDRGYVDDSVQNHLLWNHDLTDEDRTWLEGFTTRWLAMERKLNAWEISPMADELGPDGKLQTIIPGAEKISDGALAQRRADQPLRPKAAQKPPGGLFDDTHKQVDLVDLLDRRTP